MVTNMSPLLKAGTSAKGPIEEDQAEVPLISSRPFLGSPFYGRLPLALEICLGEKADIWSFSGMSEVVTC